MLYKPFPIGLSLSQVGKKIPPEIAGLGCFDPEAALIPECLALERVFDFPHRAQPVVRAEIPAALLNLDAPPNQALPEYLPDGRVIYPQDRNLFHKLQKQLLEQYYQPYHHQLKAISASGQIQLGLDCHVMSLAGTTAKAQPLQPLICLSNNGNTFGEAASESKALTCASDILRDVRDVVAARFSDQTGRVLLNTPISQGQIILTHANQTVPWIRIAIAKELMLDAGGNISEKRIEILRDKFESVLVMVCKLNEWL